MAKAEDVAVGAGIGALTFPAAYAVAMKIAYPEYVELYVVRPLYYLILSGVVAGVAIKLIS